MKVFSVIGYTKCGKTTVVENLTTEFVKRGFSVGTVKEIHFDDFQLDSEGKNTWRHKKAGAEQVTALAKNETDIMFERKLTIDDLLSHYNQDIVILEGVRNGLVPQIVVAKEDTIPETSELTIAVSGRFSNNHVGMFENLPIFNVENQIEALATFVLEKTPEYMSEVDEKCCGMCGENCRSFLSKVLHGERSLQDCPLRSANVTLKIGEKQIQIVPFVEKLLKNAVLGVVKELKGYEKGKIINVEFGDKE